MSIIITYDVPSKHTELKKALFNKGYGDSFIFKNQTVYLPNTTVFHHQKHPADALKDIQAICKELNIELERCITMDFNNWDAIVGKPFK